MTGHWPNVEIDGARPDWPPGGRGAEALCRTAIDAVCASRTDLDFAHWEVSIRLTDDQAIQALNRAYRRIDAPTNVLAFPMDRPTPGNTGGPAGGLLGDIALSTETVGREATEQDKLLPDHFVHMVVHGMLHLLGYDHENDADAEEMERCEIAILSNLRIANPYAAPHMPGDPLAVLESDNA